MMEHDPAIPPNPLTLSAPPSLLTRSVDHLLRWRHCWLVLSIVLAIAAWPVSQGLKFDQSIESLYADADPHLLDFTGSRSLFGGDEFLIVAYTETDLFEEGSNSLTKEAQGRISDFAKELSAVPGIVADSTQSLAQALRFPYNRARVREIATGTLLGNDARTTGIVLRVAKESESSVSRGETIAKVREVAARHDPPAMVVGEPAQIHDMFRYVEEDGRTLFVVSIALLSFVLFILLRHWRWVLMPVAIVLASLVWTEALLVLSQMRLSMVSSMLNSLITIIGVQTAMHVTLTFRELHRERSAYDALRQTLIELAMPVWWAIATTAFGFAVLLSSHINPVASFGLMMGLGSLVVLVAVVVLVPGCVLLGKLPPEPPPTASDEWIGKGLAYITLWVERHPKRVAFVAVSLVSFAGCGFLWLHVETDFTKNFRSSSPIVQSLNFVEGRLGGAGSWEVNFPAPEELTSEYLDKVRSFAERLRSDFAVPSNEDSTVPSVTAGKLSKVIALTDALDLVPEQILFKKFSIETRLSMLSTMQSEFVMSLYNPKAQRMRFLLRAYERQPSDTKLKLIADVEHLAQETFGEVEVLRATGHLRESKSTGLFVLLAFIIESLMSDQWTSFMLSTTGITLMMWIAFRRFSIGLICLVPNLFPNILVVGLMGWCGLPINIATAMIACVSMGLTVDSSIIYVDSYCRGRAAGLRVYPALHAAHRHVGRSLVYSNLALMTGFSVLALSHFIPLVYFGLLVSLAMLSGLIGNLVFLPLLIGWWDSRREHAV